jgi:DNA-directed RNA polymerase beta subunit
VSGDAITIQYDDGTMDTKELYNNFPFNRKTSLHQTPLVQPGQRVGPDSLLAKSNFTDQAGTVALGKNARTAYMAWDGKNFEDAGVISQSFADKMRSEHIYQHDLDVDAKTRTGKKAFVSLFPSEYTRKTLDKFDPTGVIRVGEKVEYGEPLILAAKEKESAYNKVHKRGQAGHSNSSVTWDHHDPGVVTDVVMGKDGPSVVVKAYSPMRVGDKLSG